MVTFRAYMKAHVSQYLNNISQCKILYMKTNIISKPRTVKFQIFINFPVQLSSHSQKACLFEVGNDPSLEQEIKLEINC